MSPKSILAPGPWLVKPHGGHGVACSMQPEGFLSCGSKCRSRRGGPLRLAAPTHDGRELVGKPCQLPGLWAGPL